MIEPWVSNYFHFRSPRPRGLCTPTPILTEYYLGQIFWLAVLARGVQGFMDSKKIKGDKRAERICRWVLGSMRRVADFKLLDSGASEYLTQIRLAQKRLEGVLN